jgi:[ribosomal protein S5]-alanine N-acetyltransferase
VTEAAKLTGPRSEPPHASIERTKEWMSNMAGSKQNGRTDFIIVVKDGSKAIGKIGVWQDQEIGFLLARDYWGKGLAQEALQAILPHLFERIGFEHLTADIDPRNKASERLLKKVGFEFDGYQERSMQIGDEWVDSQYLKLTKERWMSVNKDVST